MLTAPPEAQSVVAGDGTVVDLLALVPLHPAEVALKVARGTDVLDRGGVTEVLDPHRPSLVRAPLSRAPRPPAGPPCAPGCRRYCPAAAR